jgi:hypothetical protein
MASETTRRRLLLAGAAGATFARPASAFAVGDPRDSAVGQVKLVAALDAAPVYWSYSGVIYAVRPAVRPVPILRLAGCQASWSEPMADGAFKISGAIMTFFRDIDTGAFLKTFANPFTKMHNTVQANVLSGGAMIYPADGGSARLAGQIRAGVVAPKGFNATDPNQALGAVRWSVVGQSVFLMTDRSWNVAVQPQLEAQTTLGDRSAFFDPSVRRMRAQFTATTIVPWMGWMEMGEAPGHLVWHSSGEKLFSITDLPDDYRAEAGSRLDMLASRPTG